MSRSATLNRRARREAFQRKERQRKVITLSVMVVGLLLVAWGAFAYFAGQSTNSDAMVYTPENVVYDQPILAIHEMGEGPAIPFLPSDQAQPAILIPEKSYDFGSIGPKDIVEQQFIIRNNGEAPLTISRAYTTCGCTTAEISASVIPPGKVAEVTLVFDAGYHEDAAGQTVRRGLIIESNDPRQSKSEIWTQASIRNN